MLSMFIILSNNYRLILALLEYTFYYGTHLAKGKDLQLDPRYTLLCSVENSNGGSSEFYVRGRAALIADPHLRKQAVRASPHTPTDSYTAFTLAVEFAFMNIYVEGKANLRRWQSAEKTRFYLERIPLER